MMFRRKVLQEMLDWKASPASKGKAIVLKGLRQVGKTFTAMQYANELYENVVYINFKESSSLKSVFDGDLIVNRMILDISASIPGIRFIPGKTIIVLDEVQECENARASVKAFMTDGRFDVICTGSLLGIKGYNKKHGKGVPVGFEHTIYMTAMDFEEFLWAKGLNEDIIDHIKDAYSNLRKVSDPIHTAMLRHFREYMCVGGLPHVVQTFISTNDMNAVRAEQLDILDEYKDDFGKHLDENESEYTDPVLLARTRKTFEAIPAQLGKENKKFQYSLLEKGGRADQFQSAIQWLIDYCLVIKCNNLSLLQLPLEGNKDDSVFKLYLQDTGLFIAMLEPGSAGDVLTGDMGIYKGAIYENIVADAFSKMGRKLYYYRRDSGSEIDFVIRYNGRPTLVEVKSKKGKAKSASYILSKPEIFGVDLCIKLGEYNVGTSEGIITLPYYMAFMLEENRSSFGPSSE